MKKVIIAISMLTTIMAQANIQINFPKDKFFEVTGVLLDCRGLAHYCALRDSKGEEIVGFYFTGPRSLLNWYKYSHGSVYNPNPEQLIPEDQREEIRALIFNVSEKCPIHLKFKRDTFELNLIASNCDPYMSKNH